MPRVLIIGLDCVPPQLLFEAFAHELPSLSALVASGVAGPLESSVPPITVPAWSVMMTGRDPGELGTYGFHDRAGYDYTRRRLASSLDVQKPTLWALATRAGLRSRVLSVPQTYPPKPLRGALVSDCLTPSDGVPFTYPEELQDEVQAITGGYMFDVADHRHQDRDALLAAVHEMTRRRFRLARAWIERDDWDLFAMVEMGPDRMHHAFWRYFAKDHPGHVPGHRFEHAIRDYYIALDREVGSLLALVKPDDVVLVVSDHGAKTMKGGIAINQWLHERGDLVLFETPSRPTPFAELKVDWSRTRAFADGGYVGRLYLNMRGREPEGVLAADEAPAFLTRLRQDLTKLNGLGGEALRTSTITPSEAYRELRGTPPDLFIYFDDLAYRAIGSVGHDGLYVRDNDTGPDDANHARHGVFILKDGKGARAPRQPLSIYDVAPTVLHHLGIAIPSELRGTVVQ